MFLNRKLTVNWRYALGEIAIVVAGVLIALTVNNWNEARQDQKLERVYIERVTADLRRDTATFAFTDRALNAKEQSLALADSVINGARGVNDTIAFLQAIVASSNFSWSQPRVRTATYQDLQSTGNLRLIRDAELRGNIVQYYEASESEYSRITNRRTGYGALTYQLLPRKAEFALDVPGAADVAMLTRRVMNPELGRAVVAERNFARFLRERNAAMRNIALQLLKELTTSLQAI